MHLFSTPIECTQCGTVVDDPTVDKCPNCGNILTERRTPSRIAGVERRYGQIRFLLGIMRFFGVITAVVGVLLFIFGEDSVTWPVRLMLMLGGALLAIILFVVAALFEVALDIEENTRATFKLQQLELEGGQPSTRRAREAE